jgi:hypothetical protein
VREPPRAADAGVIAVVAVLVHSTFISGIGFYSDDWAMLSSFHFSSDQSLTGLVRAVWKHCDNRPVQAIYYAVLYALFGMNPLGYHVANLLVWLAIALLLHLALLRLRVPRWAAVAAAALYLTLPTASTPRFWFAAFAGPLSVALYLASLNLDLWSVGSFAATGARAATPHHNAALGGLYAPTTGRLVVGRITALIALVASTLTYEVAMPLFFLNPLLARLREGRRWTMARWVMFLGANAGALMAVAVYKVTYSPRLGADRGVLDQIRRLTIGAFRGGWVEGDMGFNLSAALGVHGWTFSLGLPLTVLDLSGGARAPDVLAAIAVAAVVALAVRRLAAQDYAENTSADYADYADGDYAHSNCAGFEGSRSWLWLAAGGVVVFLGGYAIFLTTRSIQIVTTGAANRTAVAATMGTAILIVALCALAVRRVQPARARAVAAGLLVAVPAALGTFVLARIGSYWQASTRVQAETLARIRQDVPSLVRGGTLVLDGVCPYVGPAIVFESSWDLAGALQLAYSDPALTADTTTHLEARPTRIVTSLYGEEQQYPYSDEIVLYDAVHRRAIPLLDAEITRRYLAARRDACPPGKEGVGVPVLKRGVW